MTKKMRIMSAIIAAVICFVMLFSVCYISANATHECSGNDCEICYQIGNCFIILKTSTLAVVAVSAVLAAVYTIVSETQKKQYSLKINTLVSLKVKLSN